MGFRTERLRANKTVKEVMKHMGVSDATVYYWENGDTMPSADKLLKLAKFYRCKVDALLTDNPTKRSVQ